MISFIKSFCRFLYKWLPAFLSIVALIISLQNVNMIQKTNKRVDEIIVLVTEQNQSIENHLQAIEAHLSFIDKWAHQEYLTIYGDVEVNRSKIKK